MVSLAPIPDFRYVYVIPEAPPPSLVEWIVGGVGVTGTLATLITLGGAYAFLAGSALVTALAVLPRRPARDRFALVPWGILIENDSSTRALSWASVSGVDYEPVSASDAGSSSITHTDIRVATRHGQFSGRSTGEAPLGDLAARLAAYAAEQSHVFALDLYDDTRITELGAPICEPICGAARGLTESADLRSYLGLQSLDYRGLHRAEVSADGIERLRAILRDRTPRVPDRRGLACALVGELALTELLEEMYWLIASPHPALAALAKHAARRAGGSLARAGGIEEVAPFLHASDVEFLSNG